MAPLNLRKGLAATILLTPCAAFYVPAGPTHTVFRGASRSPVISSKPRVARTIAEPRATRLAFSPLSPVDDDATVAAAGPTSPAASQRRPAAGRGGAGSVGLTNYQRGRSPGMLKAISDAGGGDLEGGGKDLTAVRRALLLATWFALTAYAFGPWSPGATVDPKDLELATQLISVSFTESPPETAVFSCIFYAFAYVPVTMASVLIGGGAFGKGRQPVPPEPFVFGAFALGFFSVGPYLAARNYLPRAAMEDGEETSKTENVLTSKFLAAPVLALAVSTTFYLVSALTNPEAMSSFYEMFWTSKFVHVSTIDCTLLSLAIVDPLREDMRRRGVEPEAAKVALYAVPLIGPALWMLVRPAVEC